MKKRVIALLAMVCIIVTLLSACGQNWNVSSDDGTYPSTCFTERTIQSAEDALAAIQDVSGQTGIANAADVFGECVEFSILDSTVYRFTQAYNGVPVYGRSIVVGAAADGTANGLSHNYMEITDIDTTPAISEKDAAKTAATWFGSAVEVLPGELSIYSLYDHVPTLAWQFQVWGPGVCDTCFVDANSGEMIVSFSGVFTDTEIGTYSDSIGTIDFNTTRNEYGSYSLVDEERNLQIYDADKHTVAFVVSDDAGNIYHYDSAVESWIDAGGKKVKIPGETGIFGSKDILDSNGTVVGHNADCLPCVGNPLRPLSVLMHNSTEWTNQKAAAAMSLTADVYDFYEAVLKKDGFNGNKGRVHIVINDDNNGDSKNAFSALGATRMFTLLSFGHQAEITAELVGHEYAHSVEQSISGLIYQGESGSIMEGLSDVFGELLEDWVVDNKLDDDCDWIHRDRNMINPMESRWSGCHYLLLNAKGNCPVQDKNGEHIKNNNKISEPTWYWPGSCWISFPYPDTYCGEGYCTEAYDKYGVHLNSTVISHAAYLMTHPKGADDVALTNEELAKVLHHSLYYLPSDCSFETFAAKVCLSAEVLGLPEEKQHCIVQAFKNVGIDAADVTFIGISEPEGELIIETPEPPPPVTIVNTSTPDSMAMNNYLQEETPYAFDDEWVYFTNKGVKTRISRQGDLIEEVAVMPHDIVVAVDGIIVDGLLFNHTGSISQASGCEPGRTFVDVEIGDMVTNVIPYHGRYFFLANGILKCAGMDSVVEKPHAKYIYNGIVFELSDITKSDVVFDRTLIETFGIYDSYIVAIGQDDSVWVIDLSTENSAIKVVEGEECNRYAIRLVIAIDGDYIYYSNEKTHEIDRVNFDGTIKETGLVKNGSQHIHTFNVADGNIYYMAQSAGGGGYSIYCKTSESCYEIAQGEEQGVQFGGTSSLSLIDDWIYFSSARGFWRAKMDGSRIEKISEYGQETADTTISEGEDRRMILYLGEIG